MDRILYVLAILGCGDDAADCRQVRIEPVRFHSLAACREALPDRLRQATDVDYPVVSAACQRRDARLVDRGAARPAS